MSAVAAAATVMVALVAGAVAVAIAGALYLASWSDDAMGDAP